MKTFSYDSAEYLNTTEAINAYMEEALTTDDPALIAKALGTITRARDMSQKRTLEPRGPTISNSGTDRTVLDSVQRRDAPRLTETQA